MRRRSRRLACTKIKLKLPAHGLQCLQSKAVSLGFHGSRRQGMLLTILRPLFAREHL